MASLEHYLSQQRGRQSRLAKELGLAAGTLSSIKAGHRRPSAALAQRIEAATDGEVRATALLGLEGTGATSDYEPPRPISGGRWSVRVSPDGSLRLSAGMLQALGFAPGERLLFTPEDERVRVHSTDTALKDIQAEVRAKTRPGVSLVDELIAERRAEAARE